MSSKNPFELRFDTLAMAKEMLDETIYKSYNNINKRSAKWRQVKKENYRD